MEPLLIFYRTVFVEQGLIIVEQNRHELLVNNQGFLVARRDDVAHILTGYFLGGGSRGQRTNEAEHSTNGSAAGHFLHIEVGEQQMTVAHLEGSGISIAESTSTILVRTGVQQERVAIHNGKSILLEQLLDLLIVRVEPEIVSAPPHLLVARLGDHGHAVGSFPFACGQFLVIVAVFRVC